MGISDNPLVTVYITNYNYAPYVDQAVESVLQQTFKDFELLIIDDGSTDNSREVIEKYRSSEQVQIIHQKNQGLNRTNNIALRAARGKYILRLDADDYLDPHALEVLSGVLNEHPEVGLVFPDYYMVDDQNQILEIIRRHDFREVTLLDQPAHGACTMIRKRVLLELGGYDESYSCQDGYELWLRLIKEHPVRNVNLPLFYYRQHSTNLTSNEDRILSTRCQILEKHARNSRNGRELRAVVLIPVRGFVSDQLSHALRPLGGRALLDWTVATALGAKRISDVIVSSPDDDVLAHAQANFQQDLICIKRPAELAAQNTEIEPTILHCLEEYSKDNPKPDLVVTLCIESPFRKPQQVDALLDVIEIFETDSAVAVRPDSNVFYQHRGAGLEPLHNTGVLRLERETFFREVGQMIAVRREFIEQTSLQVGGKVGHIVIDEESAFHLKSEWEWQLSELMLQMRRPNESLTTEERPLN